MTLMAFHTFKRHKEKEKEQSLEIKKYKQKAVQAEKDKKAFHNLYSNHLLDCPSVFQVCSTAYIVYHNHYALLKSQSQKGVLSISQPWQFNMGAMS